MSYGDSIEGLKNIPLTDTTGDVTDIGDPRRLETDLLVALKQKLTQSFLGIKRMMYGFPTIPTGLKPSNMTMVEISGYLQSPQSGTGSEAYICNQKRLQDFHRFVQVPEGTLIEAVSSINPQSSATSPAPLSTLYPDKIWGLALRLRRSIFIMATEQQDVQLRPSVQDQFLYGTCVSGLVVIKSDAISTTNTASTGQIASGYINNLASLMTLEQASIKRQVSSDKDGYTQLSVAEGVIWVMTEPALEGQPWSSVTNSGFEGSHSARFSDISGGVQLTTAGNDFLQTNLTTFPDYVASGTSATVPQYPGTNQLAAPNLQTVQQAWAIQRPNVTNSMFISSWVEAEQFTSYIGSTTTKNRTIAAPYIGYNDCPTLEVQVNVPHLPDSLPVFQGSFPLNGSNGSGGTGHYTGMGTFPCGTQCGTLAVVHVFCSAESIGGVGQIGTTRIQHEVHAIHFASEKYVSANAINNYTSASANTSVASGYTNAQAIQIVTSRAVLQKNEQWMGSWLYLCRTPFMNMANNFADQVQLGVYQDFYKAFSLSTAQVDVIVQNFYNPNVNGPQYVARFDGVGSGQNINLVAKLYAMGLPGSGLTPYVDPYAGLAPLNDAVPAFMQVLLDSQRVKEIRRVYPAGYYIKEMKKLSDMSLMRFIDGIYASDPDLLPTVSKFLNEAGGLGGAASLWDGLKSLISGASGAVSRGLQAAAPYAARGLQSFVSGMVGMPQLQRRHRRYEEEDNDEDLPMGDRYPETLNQRIIKQAQEDGEGHMASYDDDGESSDSEDEDDECGEMASWRVSMRKNDKQLGTLIRKGIKASYPEAYHGWKIVGTPLTSGDTAKSKGKELLMKMFDHPGAFSAGMLSVYNSITIVAGQPGAVTYLQGIESGNETLARKQLGLAHYVHDSYAVSQHGGRQRRVMRKVTKEEARDKSKNPLFGEGIHYKHYEANKALYKNNPNNYIKQLHRRDTIGKYVILKIDAGPASFKWPPFSYRPSKNEDPITLDDADIRKALAAFNAWAPAFFKQGKTSGGAGVNAAAAKFYQLYGLCGSDYMSELWAEVKPPPDETANGKVKIGNQYVKVLVTETVAHFGKKIIATDKDQKYLVEQTAPWKLGRPSWKRFAENSLKSNAYLSSKNVFAGEDYEGSSVLPLVAEEPPASSAPPTSATSATTTSASQAFKQAHTKKP